MPDEKHGIILQLLRERQIITVDPSTKLGASAEEIDVKASLSTAYGMDSVRIFDLIIGLEEKFGIQFDDGEITAAFDTVEGIALIVDEKRDEF